MKEPILYDEHAFEELCTAMALASDAALIGEFLHSLLTPKEIAEVASRWALVKEIDAGTTQREISKKLGLSLCKITRGSKMLKQENSAFKQMIDIFHAR